MIKSTFSDAELEGLKETLKQKTNLTINFKEVKRNKEGLISSIHIFLTGESKKASANFSVQDGVPDIHVGQKKGGEVIVSSNPPG